MCKELLATFTGCPHRCTYILLCDRIQQATSDSKREACERCIDKTGKKTRREGVCSLCQGMNGVAGDERVIIDYEVLK